MAETFKAAAASSDGIVINRHFGHADSFCIYEISDDGSFRFLEKRKLSPVCRTGSHEDSTIEANIRSLSDCRYIIVSRIGREAAVAVEKHGIIPMELPGKINESIDRLVRYKKVQDLFS